MRIENPLLERDNARPGARATRRGVRQRPAKVETRMLVGRGCGSYATSGDKARALLASWGCANPLVVQGVKIHKDAEAVIGGGAAVVFEENRTADIFAQVKVVFVL
ncbi:MAG: hypothetical protein AB7E47_08615 [Desulfovibrionaceae bacterium]